MLAIAGTSLSVAAMGFWKDPNLTEVNNFGQNPGNLKMFKYVPKNLPAGRPLVVALHGCTQQAQSYDDETGWIKFADKYQFSLLLPQEQVNPLKCFRWFDLTQNERDKGEALSIKNMIGRMTTDHQSEIKRIYVTGLSAGGAMTAVMLATYPEIFAGGAIMAGIPYKCASNDSEAQNKCGLMGNKLVPEKDLTPVQWGNLVRQAAPRAGTQPLISIWQGSADTVVDPKDAQELMEQWTNVLGIDQTPDVQDTVANQAHAVYKNAGGKALVETYLINGMGHGTAIAPGNGDNECGKAGPYILNAGICSSFYTVKFWGLDLP